METSLFSTLLQRLYSLSIQTTFIKNIFNMPIRILFSLYKRTSFNPFIKTPFQLNCRSFFSSSIRTVTIPLSSPFKTSISSIIYTPFNWHVTNSFIIEIPLSWFVCIDSLQFVYIDCILLRYNCTLHTPIAAHFSYSKNTYVYLS